MTEQMAAYMSGHIDYYACGLASLDTGVGAVRIFEVIKT